MCFQRKILFETTCVEKFQSSNMATLARDHIQTFKVFKIQSEWRNVLDDSKIQLEYRHALSTYLYSLIMMMRLVSRRKQPCLNMTSN